ANNELLILSSYNSGLVGACESGSKTLVKAMLGAGADNYLEAARTSIIFRHLHLVRYFLRKYSVATSDLFYTAGFVGDYDTVLHLLDHDVTTSLVSLLIGCLEGGHEDLVQLIQARVCLRGERRILRDYECLGLETKLKEGEPVTERALLHL